MEFKFKQFSVKHAKSAMKVGTDGNLLGAWTNVNNAKSALDIGTGCGLLALMIAQRNRDLEIDAIDIDSNAIEEAKENVNNSPFGRQIKVYENSFEDWKPSKKYDLIISNPPFFFEQYQSEGKSRRLARQGDSDWKEWLPKVAKHLNLKGTFNCIFPINQFDEVIERSKKVGLQPLRITHLFPKEHLQAHRALISFSKMISEVIVDKLIIEKKERHSYTNEYAELLKDYLIIF